VATAEEEPGWEAVAEALGSGSLLGVDSGQIDRFETHISLVVVSGDEVFKLKKPVSFGYLDYGSRSQRKRMCKLEVELNRRLAPDLYLGVRGVRGDGKFEFCDADDPAAVEHLVVMRYVDRRDMLDRRVDRVEVQPSDLAAVGRRVGEFHREARPVSPPAGEPRVVAAWVEERIAAVGRAPDGVLDPARVDAASAFVRRCVAVNARRLEARVREGFIRDGHGDLRLEHVVLGDPVRVIDCVEFDDALRAHDVQSDLSFLAMELQLAEREDLTRALLAAWAEVAGPVDDKLLWMYACARALVRIEVALSRLDQLPPGFARRVVEERAAALLDLSVRLSWRARRPRTLIFAGLSGSGKSSLSRVLSARWGLERFSSDEARKRLVGLGRDQVAPPAAYEDWVSLEVYQRLGRDAGREVAAGRCAVVDATFRRPVDAQAFVRAFRSAGALEPPITLACMAADDTLRDRVRQRAELGGSDAGLDVLEAQLRDRGELSVGISNALEVSTEPGFHDVLATIEHLATEETVAW